MRKKKVCKNRKELEKLLTSAEVDTWEEGRGFGKHHWKRCDFLGVSVLRSLSGEKEANK